MTRKKRWERGRVQRHLAKRMSVVVMIFVSRSYQARPHPRKTQKPEPEVRTGPLSDGTASHVRCTSEMRVKMVWLGWAEMDTRFSCGNGVVCGCPGLSHLVPKGVEDLWMTLGG